MNQQDNQDVWVIRTDFSNDENWDAVKRLIAEPQTDPISGQQFVAYVNFVSDKTYAGMDHAELVRSLPGDYPGFLCLIVDETTLRNEDHPVLVVDFAPDSIDPSAYDRTPSETPLGDIKSFRAIPSTIQDIENNLSIANMDFEDFSESVDENGVFRGFE